MKNCIVKIIFNIFYAMYLNLEYRIDVEIILCYFIKITILIIDTFV